MSASIADLKSKFRDPSAAELELIARYAMLPEDGRRERAFDAFAMTGLPHRRMEAWKWSDFRAAVQEISASQRRYECDPLPATDAVEIVFSEGRVDLPGSVPAGLKLHIRDTAQALGDAEAIPLGAMTASMSRRIGGLDSLVLEVNAPVETPVHIVCKGERDETNFARVHVVVREKASLDLIESHVGGAGFSSFLLEADLAREGQLTRTLLQRGAADEAQAVTALVKLDADARFKQTVLAFGAKLSRIETRVNHQGTGSEARLNAAYMCARGYHADLTSHVRHGAPSCVTRQVTKGAVLDGGTGVFQGKFLVPRHIGQHTDADMQHQALLLEEGASVFAKPELEIYADDVECAHGNTSGALDANQLFYMRQRGIPEAQARALLTEAFIAEALEDASEVVSAALLDAARNWLGQGNCA